MRCCASYLIGLALSVVALSSKSELKNVSVVKNQEIENCMDKTGGINNECLTSINNNSENKLRKAYVRKLGEISKYDYNQWWMGGKKQRDEMQQSFKISQKIWLDYRKEYCKAAGAGGEGIDGYAAIILSCHINMATRRIEEINMVHPDLSEE